MTSLRVVPLEAGRIEKSRFTPQLILPVYVCIGVLVTVLLSGCLTDPDRENQAPDLMGAPAGKWLSLFDGKTLTGWSPVEGGAYGRVGAEHGMLDLEMGRPMTAVAWAGEFPGENYEIELEAARLGGFDFFCGMTFPVGDTNCTLIVGGFGGEVLGLSNIDGASADDNATTRMIKFDTGRWYRIRLLVTGSSIDAWLDGEHIITQAREGVAFSIWPQQQVLLPFGVSSWNARAGLRDLRFRRVGENG